MESGLEDRNNEGQGPRPDYVAPGLNGVRPRRPEQYQKTIADRLSELASQWSPA